MDTSQDRRAALHVPASGTACHVLLAGALVASAGGAASRAAEGGTVGPQFVDVTASVGLDGYRAQTGDGHGPGAVFADLDDDGYPDLYLVRAWGAEAGNRLYRNVPDGTGGRRFERVAGDGGAGDAGPAVGAIAGDYDNDGDLDLYVLNFDAPNVLLQNRLVDDGGLAFIDVTASTDPTPADDEQLGLGGTVHDGIALDNSLTAAWGDPDRDGDLDLYVGNHNGFYGNPVEGPYDVPGRHDVLYRNNGDGTFTDVTMVYDVPGYRTATGAVQTANQRFSSTNAVIFSDLDNDGWPDLLVTNKVGGPDDRDMLYRNRGDDGGGGWLGFDLVTYDLEPTFGHRSGAAMGVDVADHDRDGDLDVYITDWSDLDDPGGPGRNDLWINRLAETGTLSFEHDDTLPALYSWGAQWQDFDLDGWLDLHVGVQGPAPDFLYRGTAAGLIDVAAAAGVDHEGNARGVLTADYDRDGWPDLFVVVLADAPSILYHNTTRETRPDRRALSLRLRGDPLAAGSCRSTRDAIGARVTLVADVDGDGSPETQTREVVSGSSNAASTSSLDVECGLGVANGGTGRVRWPSGRETVFAFAADTFLDVDERTIRTADVNLDGFVDHVDLLLILNRWGSCPAAPWLCPFDLDGDGVVRFEDLLLLLPQWG